MKIIDAAATGLAKRGIQWIAQESLEETAS